MPYFLSPAFVEQPTVNNITAANGTAASVSSGARAIADVGGSFNQTTLNNNFKTVQTVLADLIDKLDALGILSDNSD